MATEKEKRDKLVGALVTVGFHAAIILLFMFILAWKQPFPPKPEYGIELNIGLEQAGSGLVQPETVGDTPAEPAQEDRTEKTQPVEEEVKQEVREQPPAIPPESIPEKTEKQPEEVIPDSRQEESPVEAKPETEDKIQEPLKETVPEQESPQPEEQPAETKQPAEPVKEKTEEKPVEEQKINDKALMQPATRGGNQGETKDAKGDEGKPEGTPDARAIYGKQGGGGGGPTLDLPGWKWDFTPKPEEKSKESGKIVFEIEVDDQGIVTLVKTRESTVRPDILEIYKKEVYRLTFSPTNANSTPPPVSKGTITFIIRVK